MRGGLSLASFVISGAVMFLFEGQFGTILHTGDCRLTPDCVQNLPMKYITKKGNENICRLDFVFLDCTFSKCFLKLPSKDSAIRQVVLRAVVRDVVYVPYRSALLSTWIVTTYNWEIIRAIAGYILHMEAYACTICLPCLWSAWAWRYTSWGVKDFRNKNLRWPEIGLF